MSFYLPRLLAFAIGLIAFVIGLHLQKQERKRRELRKQRMTNLVSSVVGMYSATQAMRPKPTPQGLGSVQEQPQGQYKH